MNSLVGKAAAYRFFDTFVLIFPFYTVMFTEHGMSPDIAEDVYRVMVARFIEFEMHTYRQQLP